MALERETGGAEGGEAMTAFTAWAFEEAALAGAHVVGLQKA